MIPNKIKILGKEYKIKYVPKLEDVNTMNSPAGVMFGQITYIDGQIRIFDGLQSYDKLQVTLHEIVHAINTSLQIGIKETQIDQLATGLTNVLVDNKMLKE